MRESAIQFLFLVLRFPFDGLVKLSSDLSPRLCVGASLCVRFINNALSYHSHRTAAFRRSDHKCNRERRFRGYGDTSPVDARGRSSLGVRSMGLTKHRVTLPAETSKNTTTMIEFVNGKILADFPRFSPSRRSLLLATILSLILITSLWLQESLNREAIPKKLASVLYFPNQGSYKPRLSERAVFFYAYFEGGYLYQRNFDYFITAGIWNDDNIDYLIIVNGKTCSPCSRLVSFSNVRVIYRENKGYDFAAWGHGLSLISDNLDSYKYFIFANPSSRGPFVISGFYSIAHQHWVELFTRHLQGDTHLVGPTINCEQGPHVQSYFMAMTITALRLALANETIFISGETRKFIDVIQQSEIGLSRLLLSRGLNIASLLMLHAGHDFRYSLPSACSDRDNPTAFYGPLSILNPLEVVFWKRDGRHKDKECRAECVMDELIDLRTEALEQEFKAFRQVEIVLPE